MSISKTDRQPENQEQNLFSIFHPALLEVNHEKLFVRNADGFSLKNTFGLKAESRYFASPVSVDEIVELLDNYESMPISAMGGGSNIIFDGFFDGLIINPQIKSIELIDQTDRYMLVKVGAGIVWDDFVRFACENGLGGAENLSGIPGHVGASPVQNIGAYGVEVKDLIVAVDGIYIDSGQRFEMTNADCRFNYRDSIFKHELRQKTVVTHLTFRLTKRNHKYRLDYGNLQAELEGNEVNLTNIRQAVLNIRRAKLPDPNVLGNAGSFFKNPTVERATADRLLLEYPDMPTFPVGNRFKLSAGWLIEQAGMKGRRQGNVGVYQKQSLVLVNYGGATACELLNFAESIRDAVFQKFGVVLESEVSIHKIS
ncbi:MAG: UDP-N-acetylmuramate dehydrogenase [Prevotellaceae bacterium]|jgi:UDP-N-acetylmuramate dehydrogenase|nr:UDP-N-acetylmuramate dehydrogenase [Prevotellaceae bacterium]